MTNADRIRAMEDEELAVFITDILTSKVEECEYGGGCPVGGCLDCLYRGDFCGLLILEWLGQEAEDDES